MKLITLFVIFLAASCVNIDLTIDLTAGDKVMDPAITVESSEKIPNLGD
jgi:hypothetical protein